MVRYFLLITSLVIGFSVFSQSFHGGITAGVVGSQVAGDNFSGYNKGGLYAGGWVSLDATERSGLKMEITYFQKGSRENPTEKNGYQQYLLRLNYIEMPILYQYKLNRFTFEAGPSAGFLMGHYEEAGEQVISDYQGYIKPAQVTIQINLGVSMKINPKLGVGIRTNDSLWNVYSENQDGDVWRFWDYGRYNDSIILYAFYQFR